MANKTKFEVTQFIDWLRIGRSNYSWVERQGQEDQHNAPQPKQQHWLTEAEKAAIVLYLYFASHRNIGYRRLAYMMWWLAAPVASTEFSSMPD